MEKIILVDGNNLLFRSYFATAYNGNLMRNSKGFPTNALYGFTNMINKIITEEQPTYMIVAFDKGKTFRHEKYKEYKSGRNETPEELIAQFPKAKELLGYMGIRYYECDNYEADDILGTLAKECDLNPDFIGTIVSSDHDLLQLISPDIDIKLLKQKDYIRYNAQSFQEEYGITPIRVIDLKALMGDSSDNIPGVKGVGEKTALKLLQQYGTLDGVYQNIDQISGKLKEKLIEDKDKAYMSYDLATIYKDVPMEISLKDTKIVPKDRLLLNQAYEELEFYSLLKKEEKEVDSTQKKVDVVMVQNMNEVKIDSPCAVYLEILGTNYHTSEPLGLAVVSMNQRLFIPFAVLKENPEPLQKVEKYTYDYKKLYVSLRWHGIILENVVFDTMVAAYLLDYNIKDDIAYLAKQFNYDLPYYENMYQVKRNHFEAPSEHIVTSTAVAKADFIYSTYSLFVERLKQEELEPLYYDIEFPLSKVLGDMEYDGVYVSEDALNEMGSEMKERINELEQAIYLDAGIEFNISSPKQLGEVLFDRLGLMHGKKNKSGYSTSIDILNKIKLEHPIIEKIIDYRMLTKLYTTYIEGLKTAILSDSKIHTIYTQTLTRTGRLSSIEPNLQNIPIRNEYGRLIRKAFVPSENSIIISGDYSQIELRIMAHMANVQALIDAFKAGLDIHTKTASDIFHVTPAEVNSNMRRIAKAVNFGIIYGISSFGLADNLDIDFREAQKFIDHYLETYPGIKEYMDKTKEQAYQVGYVKTLMNRRRNIPELYSDNRMIRSGGERIALNTPIQGTSADIIKKAMVDIKKAFENQNIKSKMILQVHDELVFDALIEEKEKVIEIITEVMEQVIPLNVPLKIEIAYGNDWYEAK